MKRIDGLNVATSPPAKTPEDAPGNFSEGSATEGATQVTAEWLQGVQEEIFGVVEDVGGLSADYNDLKQMASVVNPVRALKTGGSGVVQGPTLDDRAVIVSEAGEVTAARTCIIGGEAGTVPAGGGVPIADGDGGFLAGVKGGQAGERCAVIASQDSVAGDFGTNQFESAVIASWETFVTGTRTFAAASYDSQIPAACFHSALLAAYQSSVSGVPVGAVLVGAQGSEIADSDMSLIAASRRVKTGSGSRLAIIASHGQTLNTEVFAAGDQSAIIACEGAADPETVIVSDDRNLIASSRNNVKASGPGNTILSADGAGGGTIAFGDECLIAACNGATQAIVSASHSALIATSGGQVQAAYGVVAGGTGNTVGADRAFIGGGDNNDANGVESGIVGSRDCETNNANSGALASEDCELSAQNAAAVSCGSGVVDTVVQSPQSFALGSRESIVGKAGQGQIGLACSRYVEIIASNVFGGGYAASAPANFGDGVTNKNVTAVLDFNGNYPGATGPGQLIADQGTIASPADYAELFPNAEGKPLAPAMLLGRTGKAAKLAETGDRILGIVSVNPAVLGNGAPHSWQGKLLRDKFGRLLCDLEDWISWPEVYEERVKWKEVRERYRGKPKKDKSRSLLSRVVREGFEGPVSLCPVPREDWPEDAGVYRDQIREAYHGPLADLPEGFEPPPDAIVSKQKVPRVNPDYDESKPYVPRALRPAEYVPVGLVGQLLLLCEAGTKADDYIEPGETPGVGAPTSKETRIEVMEVVEEDVDGLVLASVLIR